MAIAMLHGYSDACPELNNMDRILYYSTARTRARPINLAEDCSSVQKFLSP